MVFEYHAQFDSGAEHELCSVFIGRCDQPIRTNHDEIVAARWVSREWLGAQVTTLGGEKFTPWFILEWRRIWRDHGHAVLGLGAKLSPEPSRSR